MPNRVRHRGIVTTAAILLLPFIGLAVLVLSQAIRADANRTHRESESAQIRQLLNAGAIDVLSKLNHGEPIPAKYQAALPQSLSPAVVEITSDANLSSADRRSIMVRAKIEKRSEFRTFGFTHAGEVWLIDSVHAEN